MINPYLGPVINHKLKINLIISYTRRLLLSAKLIRRQVIKSSRCVIGKAWKIPPRKEFSQVNPKTCINCSSIRHLGKPLRDVVSDGCKVSVRFHAIFKMFVLASGG
jgi:hypothetical protein